MIKGSVNSIETFGLVDGPGIRVVVFLNGCKLRCKYCHNPEMWAVGEENYTPEELVKKIINFKPYFGNNGGVTFSGGEPLISYKFLIETCKLLKKENIHIALDTSGVGIGNYDEILKYIDLVLFDVKHTDKDKYYYLTGKEITESLIFLEHLQKSNKDIWIRQVIIPDFNDNEEYLDKLANFLKPLKNIKRVDFLPYHKLGDKKYNTLGIDSPFKDKKEMDKEKCNMLYEKFMLKYKNVEN